MIDLEKKREKIKYIPRNTEWKNSFIHFHQYSRNLGLKLYHFEYYYLVHKHFLSSDLESKRGYFCLSIHCKVDENKDWKRCRSHFWNVRLTWKSIGRCQGSKFQYLLGWARKSLRFLHWCNPQMSLKNQKSNT